MYEFRVMYEERMRPRRNWNKNPKEKIISNVIKFTWGGNCFFYFAIFIFRYFLFVCFFFDYYAVEEIIFHTAQQTNVPLYVMWARTAAKNIHNNCWRMEGKITLNCHVQWNDFVCILPMSYETVTHGQYQ